MSRLLPGAVVAALMLLIAGCGSEEGFDQDNIQVPAGFIRTVNAISDSPTLTVQVGTQSPQRLGYGQSSPFATSLPDLPLPMDVTLFSRNETVDLISDEPLFVSVDEELTVILAGSLDSPQLIRLHNDPLTDLVAETELQLRIRSCSVRGRQPGDADTIPGRRNAR
ncbi:MAG: hypothetical protein U5O39_16825 [Gammaproteobacteria bacterium]|nr:hypothetical protein [Gammaproteobacteria bacterium]